MTIPPGDFAEAAFRRRAEVWPEGAGSTVRLMLRLFRCSGLALKHSEKVVAARGLTFSEFEALAALRSVPAPHELSPSQIRGAMLLTSGGMAKVLAALADRGLVSRPRWTGDQRRKPVRLTAAGRRLIESAMADVIGADDERVSAALSHEEAKSLAALVGRLLASLENDPKADRKPERKQDQ